MVMFGRDHGYCAGVFPRRSAARRRWWFPLIAGITRGNGVSIRVKPVSLALARIVAQLESELDRRMCRSDVRILLSKIIVGVNVVRPEKTRLYAVMSRGRRRVPRHLGKSRMIGPAFYSKVYFGAPDKMGLHAHAKAQVPEIHRQSYDRRFRGVVPNPGHNLVIGIRLEHV